MRHIASRIWRASLGMLLAITAGCSVRPEEGGVLSDLFPLKVGNAWTYAYFDPAGRQLGDPWSYRISSSSSNGKSTIYYRDVSPLVASRDAYYKDETGVYIVGNAGDLVERRIAYPIVLNEEWAFQQAGVFSNGTGGSVSYLRRAVAEARETITLIKGLTFEGAVRIHYVVEGPTRPAETLRWFAPGVGLIREARLYDPSRVLELTAYYQEPTGSK